MFQISSLATLEVYPVAPQGPFIDPRSLTISPAREQDAEEVLAFLVERPVQTVVMSGLIRDNGIVSPLNRGNFYLCRDTTGELSGVALVGHLTLVEARTEAALAALADHARGENWDVRLLLGEEDVIGSFRKRYFPADQQPCLICSELLFEQRFPVEVRQFVESLRLATGDDLQQVVEIHAQMAFAESGVDPLAVDPEGFRARTLRRIEQERTWVLRAGESDEAGGAGRIIFKADIVADTPEVVYLEGIYVAPQERGKGWGVRCLSQLTRQLLARAGSVCLLVNEENLAARHLYRKAGLKQRGRYHTFFV